LFETLNGEVSKMSLKDSAHLTQMGQFAHLTVQKLKLELSKRGAKTGGRKAELIERLEAYDRNQNFQSFEVQLPSESPMPNWPDVHLFRSVTANHRDIMPQIHQTQIDQYFPKCNSYLFICSLFHKGNLITQIICSFLFRFL